uniref:Uncharacterized protein n=1 Tax=Ditylum brightwellii TaxID=49249 RepID=A0A7S2EH71_9STRA|mmetsp:Transcript_29208/g.43427  ORF Transcript_29208/g.43427 Transcript_29208/m.43427 type:complete len:375 (+) Transcript_29208:83-1207(+)
MSLFETLNHSNKDDVEYDAVIKAAQQNPEHVNQQYSFTRPEEGQRFPLHQAIKLGLPYDVIEALSSPLALKQQVNHQPPLHYALFCDASFDVVDLLLNKCPDAAKQQSGWTPLHQACFSGASVEVVRKLLEVWPNAARQTERYGVCAPLHYVIQNGSSIDVLKILLEVYPAAAMIKDDEGDTPLHMACSQNNISLEVVSALLDIWPEAVCLENESFDEMGTTWGGKTPIQLACANENATLEVVQVLLDSWLKAKKNLASHNVNSLISQETPDDVMEFLRYLSSLIDIYDPPDEITTYFTDRDENPPADEIITYFTDIDWLNGVWLVINTHPALTKTLEIPTSAMAEFLSAVGKCCSLKTMMVLIQNEPDLLEGV